MRVHVRVRTCVCEGCEVYRDVMLVVGQRAVVALQIVPVAGVLRHPLYLVATVSRCNHPGVAALQSQTPDTSEM